MHARHKSSRSSLLALRARQMRSAPTAPEAALFRLVGAGKLGVVVRRQVVLAGRFIADFYVPSARLVIEVDGRCHERRQRADARRDEVLRRLGYRVLRVEAARVMREPRTAVEQVRLALAEKRCW